mgnify:CR=1 FL=1
MSFFVPSKLLFSFPFLLSLFYQRLFYLFVIVLKYFLFILDNIIPSLSFLLILLSTIRLHFKYRAVILRNRSVSFSNELWGKKLIEIWPIGFSHNFFFVLHREVSEKKWTWQISTYKAFWATEYCYFLVVSLIYFKSWSIRRCLFYSWVLILKSCWASERPVF